MKAFLRNFLVILFSQVSRFFIPPYPIRVLALHDIDEKEREEFKRKMLWLKKHYNIVSLQDVSLSHPRGSLDNKKINVAITFDDGFKCFLNVIGEVLTELEIPATFFICSGALGLTGEQADFFTLDNLKRKSKKFEYLTTDELKKLSENPLFEIGGHTASHIDLGKVWDKEKLEKEIKDDKEKLESVIEKKINFFAYPFGSFQNMSESAVEVIKSSGYLSAFSILPAFWTEESDTFRVGRDSLTLSESDLVWRAWLAGGYDILKTYVTNR